MKIALYVSSWPPGLKSSGIVTYASQIVPELRQLGHEVFVVTPLKLDNCIDPYTIDLRLFDPGPSLFDRALLKIAYATACFKMTAAPIRRAVKYLVEKKSIDVFEMEESGGWNFLVSRLNLIPVVARLHGPWFLTGRYDDPTRDVAWNRGRQKREGRALRHAHFVTAPSAKVLQDTAQHYGLSSNCKVIPNPLKAVGEADLWNPTACDKMSILFVGRFDAIKGGDVMLRSFAELAAAYPTLTLTFVGADVGITDADGKRISFGDFVQKVVPDWCRPRLKYLGEIPNPSVMALRRQHFITVIASQYETFGYSVLEAMAVGCPVVATKVGGIPELICDNRNGLLVPAGNVGAVVASCKTLLEDHDLAVRIGRQAWLDCSRLSAPLYIAKQTIAAYEEAITKFKTYAQ